MSVDKIMSELASLGNEQTCKIFRRHGAEGEMFGVKIADIKQVLKKIKGDQQLALALWDTGNSDAMYLAGLAADGGRMTRKQLDLWAKTAWWHMLSEYSVPFVAAEHPDAFSIARKWINAKKENVASSGWATYAAAMSVVPDSQLHLDEIKELLNKIENEINDSSQRIRYCMNGFVICVGSYVRPLLKQAKATAKRIGKVDVDMAGTSCRVPVAADCIEKIEKMGRVGTKRATAKC